MIIVFGDSKLNQLLAQGTKIMAAIDDLNAAIATLQAGMTSANTAIQAEIAALTAALGTNNSMAIAGATANIAAISSRLAQDTTALVNSLTPPTAPTP
jgi:hypothetical protein